MTIRHLLVAASFAGALILSACGSPMGGSGSSGAGGPSADNTSGSSVANQGGAAASAPMPAR